MADVKMLLTLAGPATGSEPNPLASLALMATIFGIFYFILILPMKNKQKKLDELQKSVKAGDKVLINPGIFGTVVSVEDDALTVRIAEQTKIRVLRSAVAGLQGPPSETEK